MPSSILVLGDMWASVRILQYMLHTYVIDHLLITVISESISMIIVRDIISGGPSTSVQCIAVNRDRRSFATNRSANHKLCALSKY